MNRIEKYGIVLRPVEVEDAQFIIDIRNDLSKSRFISATSADLEKQENWIRNYKKREVNNEEYYFIAIDSEGIAFSTYRVYDIDADTLEIGSWVSKPDYNKGMNSIKVDLIMKEFVFEELGYDLLKFTVSKGNASVLKYHNIFNPVCISEDSENYYFELNKDTYYLNRNKFFKNIK